MLFGDQLLLRRKRLNISAEELAKKMSVSRSYVTLIENGKRMPSSKIIPEIAKALGLKTNIVINWYLEDMREKLEKNIKSTK